jgi:hypothetical protein
MRLKKIRLIESGCTGVASCSEFKNFNALGNKLSKDAKSVLSSFNDSSGAPCCSLPVMKSASYACFSLDSSRDSSPAINKQQSSTLYGDRVKELLR